MHDARMSTCWCVLPLLWLPRLVSTHAFLRFSQPRQRSLSSEDRELQSLNFLGPALYADLCTSAPCPLGLTLEDVRVVNVGGRVKHLAVLPPPGRTSLDEIRAHLTSRQHTGGAASLHRAGWCVVSSNARETWLEVLVTRCPAHEIRKIHRQPKTVVFARTRHRDGTYQKREPPRVVYDKEEGHGRDFNPLRDLGRQLSNLTGTASMNKSAAEFTGVKTNKAGDLPAFLSSLCINVIMVILYIKIFCILRRIFPVVFRNGVDRDHGPDISFIGWTYESWHVSTERIEKEAGLDQALLVEFTHFGMRTLAVVGLPLILVLCPLHVFCGKVNSEDLMSLPTLGNVQKGSWICWVHSFAVWYVVLMTQFMVFRAQAWFVQRRAKWLKDMLPPRSSTVLVEQIPLGQNTDEGLKMYFDETVFARPVVKSTYIVKDTSEIQQCQNELTIANHALAKARSQAKSSGDPKTGFARIESSFFQTVQARVSKLETKISELQTDIDSTDKLNTRAGFVTFEQRRDALIAVKMFSASDEEEIVVSQAPEPSDIIWKDLFGNEGRFYARETLGYSLIFTLFICFIPLIIFVAWLASIENLQKHFQVAVYIATELPTVAAFWDAIIGSLALTTLMGFLPTILMAIFSGLFALKSQALRQHLVQCWFYQFQVVFVLLITSIGTSLLSTAAEILDHPPVVFSLLARNLPNTTNFYANLITLQWAAHAMTLMRHANVFKYVFLARIYDEHKAKELAEPEDQDYQGMGSRYARFTLFFVVPLTFCTLTPLITLLGIVNFAVCKLVYSELLTFVETRKADLGGVFWVSGLRHIQQGLYLFVTLMAGVLLERSSSSIPALIAMCSFVFLWESNKRFKSRFRWEYLEFSELSVDYSKQEVESQAPPGMEGLSPPRTYKQPELPPPRAAQVSVGAELAQMNMGRRPAAAAAAWGAAPASGRSAQSLRSC